MDHPSSRTLTLAVGCLLVVAGVLLYLEWWRAGELVILNERVNQAESNVSSLAAHVAARQKTAQKAPATRRRATQKGREES